MLNKRIGEILVDMQMVTPEARDQALSVQKERPMRLGQILVAQERISESDLYQALGLQFGLPFEETIDGGTIDPSLVADLTITYAKQHGLLPLARVDGQLRVALSDPLAVAALDDLRAIFRCEIDPVLAPPQAVMDAINTVFDRRAGAEQVMDDIADQHLDSLAHELEETTKDLLEADDEEAPIIRLVNSVMGQAIKEKASDIHIEPFEKHIDIRFRKDGILHKIVEAPKRFHASLSSRIKIMGDLNIAEKRIPQDGRIRIKIAGRDVDIRLSTIPTSHGERLVMRILDKSSVLLDLPELGLLDRDFKRLDTLIRRPHGILLVTGPTGSGKTTTLYAALSRINTPDKNILTIEDPVEYQLEGIGQMQVNPKINFTFASGLRATLRQDPDVVLVGEIRDLETADIAVQASLTGHLVFSTVHTNDSASTITRLADMGVEPFLIGSSVIAILAQRLIRKICRVCRKPYSPNPDDFAIYGPKIQQMLEGVEVLYHANGCDECGQTGYAGRLGIYELLVVDEKIRQLVMKNAPAPTLKKVAIEAGLTTLREDGVRKAILGVSSMEEVMRVTQDDSVVI
ncbi:MAG: type II secretion system ATPase GspE [Myxococcales bacterium]|nr:type II secretion system ATPase GspE [Myxococcales bacterium]